MIPNARSLLYRYLLEARADEEAFRKAIIRLGEFQELHHIR